MKVPRTVKQSLKNQQHQNKNEQRYRRGKGHIIEDSFYDEIPSKKINTEDEDFTVNLQNYMNRYNGNSRRRDAHVQGFGCLKSREATSIHPYTQTEECESATNRAPSVCTSRFTSALGRHAFHATM